MYKIENNYVGVEDHVYYICSSLLKSLKTNLRSACMQVDMLREENEGIFDKVM